VQQTGSHFVDDRGVEVLLIGCVVSLQRARLALGWCGLCFGSKLCCLSKLTAYLWRRRNSLLRNGGGLEKGLDEIWRKLM